eukprot:1709246-Prymnesium_polylepis.1
MPGPYIKWFVAAVGNDGLCNLLTGHDDKSAYCQVGATRADRSAHAWRGGRHTRVARWSPHSYGAVAADTRVARVARVARAAQRARVRRVDASCAGGAGGG